jgi:hypothetical protein
VITEAEIIVDVMTENQENQEKRNNILF